MEDFIAQAQASLGVSDDVARSATGQVLGFIKEEAGEDTFSQLADEVPGAAQLASTPAPEADSGGGGLLGGFGGLASAATSMLGGAGGAGGLVGMLTKSGLDLSKAGSLVTMLVSYLKTKISPELLETIVSKVPALKSMMG